MVCALVVRGRVGSGRTRRDLGMALPIGSGNRLMNKAEVLVNKGEEAGWRRRREQQRIEGGENDDYCSDAMVWAQRPVPDGRDKRKLEDVQVVVWLWRGRRELVRVSAGRKRA